MSIKKLYRHSENIANRYYSYYTHNFHKLGYTIEDLKQEAKIMVLEIITKYKDKNEKELKKIVNQGVGWRINEILRDKTEPCLSFEEIYYIPHKRLGGTPDTFFILLKPNCTEKEYNLLIKKFKEDKNNSEIATELGISKVKVGNDLKILYEKIKKILKNKNSSLLF